MRLENEETSRLWEGVESALRSGSTVFLRSPLLERLSRHLGKEVQGRVWLILEPADQSGPARVIVRARDVICSALALLVLSPLLLLIALLVKASSPGPVFYSTQVVGANRKKFLWRKFRSMRLVTEDQEAARKASYQDFANKVQTTEQRGQGGKIVDESRVTAIGAILRKFSLDELPQLWNVLRGDMTLVGPRPCLPYEAECYTGWRARRFSVRPGLTGVWQVFGRGEASFDETAALDVYYTFRRSFRFDAHLILRTLLVVLTGKGGL